MSSSQICWDFRGGRFLPNPTPLLKKLVSAVEATQGRRLTFSMLSAMTDEPRSTLCRWLNGEGEPSVKCLILLAERVPRQQWQDLFAKALRWFPSFDHPSLCHDPAAIARCRSLANQKCGLTLIQGQESSVTFFMAVLANSFRMTGPRNITIFGVDAHAPDWFVPAPGISYMHDQAPAKIAAEVRAALQRRTQNAKVLINAGDAVYVFEREIGMCARRNHLLLANLNAKRPVCFSQPFDFIEINSNRSAPDRLEIRFTRNAQ